MRGASRVADQPGFILHSYPYSETSLLVETFTRAHGRIPLIAGALKSRKLVAPFSDRVASPRGYFVVASKAAAAKPEVQDFMAWMKAEARDLDSARPTGRGRA